MERSGKMAGGTICYISFLLHSPAFLSAQSEFSFSPSTIFISSGVRPENDLVYLP